MKETTCKVCGKMFQKKCGNQKCCSKECSDVSRLNQIRAYNRNHPERHKPAEPREIVCSRCGKIFMGKSNQQICMHCLHTIPECRKYLGWRSDTMKV